MKFAEAAARLDVLEDIQNDWPGGWQVLNEAVDVAEAQAMAATPVTAEDRAWLYARYERAIANDWCDEARAPLLSALARATAA